MHARLTSAAQTIDDLPEDKALPFALHTIHGLTSFCGETLSRVGQSHLIQRRSSQSTPTSGSTSGARRSFTPPLQIRTPQPRPPPVRPPPQRRPTPQPRPPPVRPPPQRSPQTTQPPRPPPPPQSSSTTTSTPTLSLPLPPPVSPPLIYHRYQRQRWDDSATTGLHVIPEEGDGDGSSSAQGKRQRRT